GRRTLFGLWCASAATTASLALVAQAGAAPAVTAASQLQVTTQPALYPTFDQNITDYVVRCTDGVPIQVSVNQPSNSRVSVDNQAARKGSFTTQVTLNSGQAFAIVYSQ